MNLLCIKDWNLLFFFLKEIKKNLTTTDLLQVDLIEKKEFMLKKNWKLHFFKKKNWKKKWKKKMYNKFDRKK